MTPPTDEDREILSSIVAEILGPGAKGYFYEGLRAKGIKGDEPHYGYVIMLDLERSPGFEMPFDMLDKVAHEISARIPCAGNIVMNITPV